MNCGKPFWMLALARDGAAIVPDVIGQDRVRSLLDAVGSIADESAVRTRESATYAVRNLLSLAPAVRELCRSLEIRGLVEPVLGPGARAIRGILFDKAPGANWKVAWHQDLSIAVKRRVEHEGFGPWSEKAGVAHVQPPVEVLEKMLTVRVHLDDCPAENGALRVIAGSHAMGIVPSGSIAKVRESGREIVCEVTAGGALLMRPLILHASSSATVVKHRRVIHIEYTAADALPAGIEWQESDEGN